jgi:uncharacterized membrane protein
MRTVITTIVIAVALTASATTAVARPAAENPQGRHSAAFAATPSAPAFPSGVPSQPGELTGQAATTKSARAQERYYASYGDAPSLSPRHAAVDAGGVDWATIGITIGGTAMLLGAVIARVMRTRLRTSRSRVIA